MVRKEELKSEVGMNKEASVELLQNLLRIYSPSGKEEKLATFLQKELERLGFERVWKDETGNVYGEIGSGVPAVLLCGHMDTVPGKIAVKTENGHLYGRGAVDAKASLAAMICAASSLGPDTRAGRAVVACVIEEESSANGIRQLLREDLDADYAVFGEPSGVKNITFAYKGKLGLRITCRTVSGHIGAQHLLDSAIEMSFELWKRIKTYCATYKSPHGVFYSLTPCLTHISSERTQGGVPDLCTMDVDLRLPPKIKSGKAVALVEEIVGAFRVANQGASVSFEITDRVEPFVAKRTTPLMEALQKAILKTTGGPAKFLRKTGTGDMNIFGPATGIPVATYGPGEARLGHTSHEHITISEYLTSIEVYKSFLKEILLKTSD